MLVYRLEDNDGLGAYAARGSMCLHSKNCDLDAETGGRHPTPCRDTKLRRWFNAHFLTNFVCGFATLGQYRRWFHTREARQHLADLDLGLIVYKVPMRWVRLGSRQVMFHKGKAVWLTRLKPTTALRFYRQPQKED